MAVTKPISGSADTDADADASPTLTQSTLHEVLSNTRRILVIDALAEPAVESDADGWVLLTDIADVLEDWLGIDDEDRNIYRSLYHSHAPKLDEYGAIEQRKEDGRRVVRPGPNFRAVVNARNAVALALGVSANE